MLCFLNRFLINTKLQGIRYFSATKFTPPDTKEFGSNELQYLKEFLKSSRKLAVITGAGISTESGLPDYRSPNGSYSKGHKPITYSEFMKNLYARQRYWARNMQGFPIFSSATPNEAHHALAHFEEKEIIHHIITQNVDRLHHKAGNKNVIELHGNSFHVVCTNCHKVIPRAEFQKELAELNPSWVELAGLSQTSAKNLSSRPDFDVELGNVDYNQFKIPTCKECGGLMKPTFVFFGENVPKEITAQAFQVIHDSDAVLVCGTSLQVYSAFRYVKAAHEKKIPIVVINIGPTRADEVITKKIEARCGEVLPQLQSLLESNSIQ